MILIKNEKSITKFIRIFKTNNTTWYLFVWSSELNIIQNIACNTLIDTMRIKNDRT